MNVVPFHFIPFNIIAAAHGGHPVFSFKSSEEPFVPLVCDTHGRHGGF